MLKDEYINPSIYNICITLVRWADGTNDLSTKRLICQVSFFFHKILQNSLQKPFQFIFLFSYKITQMKIKSFECSKSIRNYETKILGTSDAWSTSRLSHWPREPVYYIVDCRISSTTIRHQRLNKSEIFLFSWSQLKIW